MNKSDIEWTEFTSNPVKGECPVGCSYCYVKPFRTRYGWHKDIRFYPAELEAIRRRKKPARIFIGSTIELFHDKTIQYMPEIMDTVKACPWHTIMFLTKQPKNLVKWSPFPDNCYVGVTATDMPMFRQAMKGLIDIQAKVKYISFEPLLEEVFVDPLSFQGVMGWQHENALPLIQWVIIGAQTKPYKPPKIEWVEEIVRACDQAKIPVFLKNNLRPLIFSDPLFAEGFVTWAGELRQELPFRENQGEP